jgi:hypothetical protein
MQIGWVTLIGLYVLQIASKVRDSVLHLNQVSILASLLDSQIIYYKFKNQQVMANGLLIQHSASKKCQKMLFKYGLLCFPHTFSEISISK